LGLIVHILGFGYFLGRWRDPEWGQMSENQFSRFMNESVGFTNEPVWMFALLWEITLPLWLLWSAGRLAMRAGEEIQGRIVTKKQREENQAEAQEEVDRLIDLPWRIPSTTHSSKQRE
jgi:hypothetical protein